MVSVGGTVPDFVLSAGDGQPGGEFRFQVLVSSAAFEIE